MMIQVARCLVGPLPAHRCAARLRASSPPSLYEEAERGLTERGKFEASLTTLGPELAAATDPTRALREDGVARVDKALSGTTAARLRDFVMEERKRSEEAVLTGKVPRLARFADVLLKEHRADVLLPLDELPVLEALRELLSGPVGGAVEAVVGSDAKLRELSCLVADSAEIKDSFGPRHTVFKNSILIMNF